MHPDPDSYLPEFMLPGHSFSDTDKRDGDDGTDGDDDDDAKGDYLAITNAYINGTRVQGSKEDVSSALNDHSDHSHLHHDHNLPAQQVIDFELFILKNGEEETTKRDHQILPDSHVQEELDIEIVKDFFQNELLHDECMENIKEKDRN